MPSKFAPVNGTQVHYEERGHGRALLLLHAGVNNMAVWDAQMDAFSPHYRTVRYDYRGWGETVETPGQFSDHEDLRGLLDHLSIDTAVLLGNSHGGAIALDFALAYPERTTALVLVAPGLPGYDFTSEGIAETREMMIAKFEAGDVDGAVALSVDIWLDGVNRPPGQVPDAVRRRATELTRHTFLLPDGAGERVPLAPPAIERLAEIDVPVLLLIGEHDVPDIHHIADILTRELPHVTRVDMLGTAHLPALEQPQRFNQHVLAFLQRLPEDHS